MLCHSKNQKISFCFHQFILLWITFWWTNEFSTNDVIYFYTYSITGKGIASNICFSGGIYIKRSRNCFISKNSFFFVISYKIQIQFYVVTKALFITLDNFGTRIFSFQKRLSLVLETFISTFTFWNFFSVYISPTDKGKEEQFNILHNFQ